MESYKRGLEAGDRHLYFVDGSEVFPSDYRDECSADGCHPNDAGFVQMAERIGGVLRRAIRME